MKELFRDTEVKMKHAVDHLHAEMKHLRTGRASPALLDGITVDYYGTPTPISQVANLSVADATLLLVQPWDGKQIPAIEKAIRQGNLGLNPNNDGKVIRVPIPSLTEDRRRDLVKKAHDAAEHCRTGIRQARREGNDKLKTMEKDKQVSEDDEHRGMEEIQKLHDHYIAEVGKILEHKETDILAV